MVLCDAEFLRTKKPFRIMKKQKTCSPHPGANKKRRMGGVFLEGKGRLRHAPSDASPNPRT